MKKLLIILAAACALSGCASFSQGVSAYEQAGVAGARLANDNIIVTWSTAACATPLSAALRHPEVIPALRALCLPAGTESSPAALLDTLTAGARK